MSELDAVAAAWWGWMAPVAVQAAAFVAFALLLDALLARRSWPQLRHALWLLAALRFALPPGLASPVSIGGWLGGSSAPLGANGSSVAAAAGATPDSPSALVPALLALWLVGVAIAAALAVRGALAARSATRGVSAPDWIDALATRCARRLGLRRVPPVVLVGSLSSACVRGLLRPVVALPADVERDDVEVLLLHELAHVRRRDLWAEAGLSVLRALFWFHPGLWLVSARVSRLRELCCDATAAAALGPRAGEYRATLLRAAARLLGEPPPRLAFVGGTSQIVLRLRALERAPSRRPALRSATTALVTLLLAACALPMARQASPAGPDVASIAAARHLIASALDGSARPGCIRLHYAAMLVAADPASSPDSSDPFDSPLP